MESEVKTVLVEHYYQQSVHYTLLVGAVSIVEILALINQMEYSSTQAVSGPVVALAGVMCWRLFLDSYQNITLDCRATSCYGFVFVFNALDRRYYGW